MPGGGGAALPAQPPITQPPSPACALKCSRDHDFCSSWNLTTRSRCSQEENGRSSHPGAEQPGSAQPLPNLARWPGARPLVGRGEPAPLVSRTLWNCEDLPSRGSGPRGSWDGTLRGWGSRGFWSQAGRLCRQLWCVTDARKGQSGRTPEGPLPAGRVRTTPWLGWTSRQSRYDQQALCGFSHDSAALLGGLCLHAVRPRSFSGSRHWGCWTGSGPLPAGPEPSCWFR